MIEFKQGDMFGEDVEALVNPVNCVGRMGKGLALAIKTRFPESFPPYEKACAGGLVRPGEMFLTPIQREAGPRLIIHFPTKRHWRSKSRLEDIVSGLKDLRRVIRVEALHSLGVPALGAGLGGLSWTSVKNEIDAALRDVEGVRIIVFEPQ